MDKLKKAVKFFQYSQFSGENRTGNLYLLFNPLALEMDILIVAHL
jgi:hypothetical protein